MPVAVPRFGAEECPLLPPVRGEDLEGLVIRPATVRDVHGMSALINQYAAANVMLARGPQYLYQHIQDYMVAVTPAADGKTPVVVACGALHVLWEDRMVAALVEHCRALGLPRVFAFTLAATFFARCGFSEYQRDKLPPVVWVECSKCPKFYCCDETAMILEL